MAENKSRLVIEGNAFYEIDLECIKHQKNNKKNTDSAKKPPVKTNVGDSGVSSEKKP